MGTVTGQASPYGKHLLSASRRIVIFCLERAALGARDDRPCVLHEIIDEDRPCSYTKANTQVFFFFLLFKSTV